MKIDDPKTPFEYDQDEEEEDREMTEEPLDG